MKSERNTAGVMLIASTAITLILVAVIVGLIVTSLNSAVSLTGTANTTYYGIQTNVWSGLQIAGILVIIVAAVLILGYLTMGSR
jgi:uncharacterized membrane protein